MRRSTGMGAMVGVLLLVCFGALMAVANDEPAVRRTDCLFPSEPQLMAEWTVFFLSNADHNVSNATDWFANQFRPSDSVNVLVLEDTSDGGAMLWQSESQTAGAVLQCLQDWGEVDMADGETLQRLIEIGRTWFPAKRDAVMIYGHGLGWKGASYDQAPGSAHEPSWLTPQEIRIALESVGGIDALMFTAPCTMGAVEVAAEVKSVTELFIASEIPSCFNVWNDALAALSSLLMQSPDASLEVVAETVVRASESGYSRSLIIEENNISDSRARLIPYASLTAVVSGDAFEHLVSALDAFARSLLDVLDSSISQIEQARWDSQETGSWELVDISDLALHCRSIEGMEVTADELIAAVDVAVVQFFVDTEGYPNAQGLSVYFPMEARSTVTLEALAIIRQRRYLRFQSLYSNSGLDLINDTQWDEFLAAFYGKLLDP